MRFGRGKVGVKLKANSRVMGQNQQLPPCTVGGVMLGRDGIQREFSLELGKAPRLRPTTSDEVPQCARAEREVSGDPRILEVAVIGGEEIELVIVPALQAPVVGFFGRLRKFEADRLLGIPR